MHLLCPHCHNPIELVELKAGEEIVCGSCGSGFHLDASSTKDDTNLHQALGRFRLIGAVGQGAFGTVYKARDPELDRIVAVKVPRRGNVGGGPGELERFVREARSVAQLRHPSIVAVHEVGTQDGTPYLVSDFVEGVTLADLLTARRPGFHEAAEIIARVADALDYAHRQGVIHRDVKPSNVMIRPDGGPCVMDFGLAKRDAGEVTMTMDGHVLGTPAYMSPEQARGQAHTVDGRSDVYSLGVMLYQLLTGELPFRGNMRMLMHQVLHDEPKSPRTLNDRIPRDLETVTLRAMAKEPGRRYASAGELAEDLRRWLKGEPVRARPVGRLERGWRWSKRNPAVAALTAAVVVVLLAGTAVAMAFAIQAERRADAEEKQRLRAEKGEADAREKKRLLDERLETARQHVLTAQLMRVAAVYEQQPQRALELLHDAEACPIDIRDPSWHLYDSHCRRGRLLGHSSIVTSVAFSPDGKTLASRSEDGSVKLWDPATGQACVTPQGHFPVRSMALSPDGKTLVLSSGDKTIKLWDVASGKERATLQGHTGVVDTVAYSPDGKALASGSRDRTIKLWDLASGQARATLQGHTELVVSVAYSPDGKTLASGSADGTVKLWDVATGRERATLKGHNSVVTSVAFSPDGKTLASGSWDKTVRLWDAATGQARATLQGHFFSVRSVAFSPDGKTLVSGSEDKTVKVWDAATGQARATLEGHTDAVRSVAYSPDGKTLASGGGDRAVKLWDMAMGQERGFLKRNMGTAKLRALSRDGRTLATSSDGETVKLWDVATGQERASLKVAASLPNHSLALSPDGKTLASWVGERTVKLWDATTGQERVTLKIVQGGNRPDSSKDRIQMPIGPFFALPGSVQQCTILTVRNSSEIPCLLRVYETGLVSPLNSSGATLKGSMTRYTSPPHLEFSPDGRTLATSIPDPNDADLFADVDTEARSDEPKPEEPKVSLWDVATGQKRAILKGHSFHVSSMAFSPDGKALASGSNDGRVRLWDLATGKARATLQRHNVEVTSVAYSPDGKTLASGSQDGTIKLWDVATRQERALLKGHTGWVRCMAFSPDGKTLVSGALGAVKVWDVATGQERATLKGQSNQVHAIVFSPDGCTLISDFKFWDVSPGSERAILTIPSGTTESVSFTPDGNRLVSHDKDGTNLVWNLTTGQLVEEPLPADLRPGPVSPDGRWETRIDGDVIRVIDRNWKPPQWQPIRALGGPDPDWHEAQAAECERDRQWFAAGFHLGKLAGFEPWDASLRWKEAEAWTKAGQKERAARAFVQALLLDPGVAGRQR